MSDPRVFLAAVEHGVPHRRVVRQRTAFGKVISGLGFFVVDPTLSQDVGTTPRELRIHNDRALIETCDLVVAYLPRVSKGVRRELTWAQELGLLVVGFTDRGNSMPKRLEALVSTWCAGPDDLVRVLKCRRHPPGQYFTSAYTNGIRGDVLIYGTELHEAAPGIVVSEIARLRSPARVYHFCCERSHINELAQKLPTMLRLGRIRELTVLSKDGSPHDVQMHTLVEEVIENQGFPGRVRHLVAEHGHLVEVDALAVRRSRHLSSLSAPPEQRRQKPAMVLVLAGAASDEAKLREATFFDLLRDLDVQYDFHVVSSDRHPERLRTICRTASRKVSAVVAFAGGVPNLPVAAKAWLPNVPVVGVPLDEDPTLALVALTTPKDRPVFVPGFGRNGIRKAAIAARELSGNGGTMRSKI